MLIRCNNIYTPHGIESGVLKIENGKFQHIYQTEEISDVDLDYSEYKIIPGFIDIHVHGYGRGSFGYKGDEKSIKNMSIDLTRTGVTAFLPTSGAMPKEFLEKSYQAAKKVIESFEKGYGAEPVGIHMEGPFINEKYLGMQRIDCLQKPSIETFEHYNKLSGNHIKVVTLAPELEGSIELIKYLSQNGIYSSAGHTSASFEQIRAAIEAGLTNFTHTFSGMKGFHHRELGVVGAAMYFKNTYAEVAKQTGITIKPEAFDILYRLKGDEGMVMMTDNLGYGGFPEGYKFHHYLRKTTFSLKNGELIAEGENNQKQIISLENYENVKDLEMGFMESVKNVIERLDNGLFSVMKLASENPAKIAGVFDRKGSIEVGKDADFIVLNKELDMTAVYCYGKQQI